MTMQVSREYVLKELIGIRDVLNEWIGEIEKPARFDDEGNEVPVFPDGVPAGIPVAGLGLPVEQLRAELVGVSGRIEALVTAG